MSHPPTFELIDQGVELAVPCLPVDGSIRIGHRHPGKALDGIGLLGRRLALVWSRAHTMPGELPTGRDALATAAAMTDPTVMEAVGLVGTHLGATHNLREQAIARLLAEIGRFALYLEANGVDRLSLVVPHDCRDFIDQAVMTPAGAWAEPSSSTQHVRRSAIRLLYGTARTLQLATADPTLDIKLPPRSGLSTRPLGDDEETLGRIWAQPTLDGTRHAAAWSLGQATATGTEQAATTVADLDLGSGRVWLHGNELKREPRWGHLTEWGIHQLDRRLAAIGTDPTTPVVTAATASRNAGQASTSAAVREVLVHAGLSTDPAVRPGSLPAWAGVVVLDRSGRIDEVAHTLGIRSLDRAAETIGWAW